MTPVTGTTMLASAQPSFALAAFTKASRIPRRPMVPTAVKTPSLTSSASRTQTLKLTSATPRARRR